MHPAVIALLVVDVVGAIAIGLAMVQSARVAVGWDASSASAQQLRLERQAEEGAAAGRLGAILHAVGALGTLLLINHVLPALVPGAMCGVGVMQALPEGWATVAMRALSLVALCAWFAVDRLNRKVPTGPLAPPGSRWMLVAGAASLIATWRSLSSLSALDLHKAVSCCAAVYDLGVRSGGAGRSALVAGWSHAFALIGIGAVVIAAAFVLRKQRPVWMHAIASSIALGFVAFGAWVLVDFTAPVIYGTLGHRCPLCLFSPAHGGFGYLAFGALAWLTFETASSLAVVLVSRDQPQTVELATARARTGWARSAMASAAFLVAAIAPQITWWLRFGVTIGGE